MNFSNFSPFIKQYFKKDKLKFLELFFLSLFLLFLPALEAPKNLFLSLYVCFALFRLLNSKLENKNLWDLVFLSLILSAFLSALFAGIPNASEWKGLRGVALWVLFGWIISRNNYNNKEKIYLFIFALAASLPAILWGLIEVFLRHKEHFQLHSVGHFNHSAIYLCMLFGGCLGLIITYLKKFTYLKYLLFSFLTINSIALVYSYSRGGLYLVTFILFAFLCFNLDLKVKLITFLIFLSVVITSLFIFQAPILEKQQDAFKPNTYLSGREKIWNGAIVAFKIFPLYGVGNGNWNKINIEDIKLSVEKRGHIFNSKDYLFSLGHAHNIYFANLVERGFFGLFTFLNFMLLWLITLFKSFRTTDKKTNRILFTFGSLSAWLSIFVIGLVNTTFHHENALLALFFLGLHLSFIRQNKT